MIHYITLDEMIDITSRRHKTNVKAVPSERMNEHGKNCGGCGGWKDREESDRGGNAAGT